MLAAVEEAESTEPARASGVPASGVWNETLGKWESVATDGPGGAREGECLRYRPDGTLYSRSHFVAGLEDGPFTVYHPDGSVARQGRYAAGRLDGVVSVLASPDGQGEPLRACCVPPGATRLDLTFRGGEQLHEVFTDREGRPLLGDGQLRPPVPPGLPALVSFDEHRGGWVLRQSGLETFWTLEGRPLDERQWFPDGHWVTRIFDDTGAVKEEMGMDPQRQRVGPYFRRLDPDAPAVYADPRIRQERGTFENGQAVGTWTFLDAAGEVVRVIDRGSPVTAAVVETSPAFAPELPDGWSTARALTAAGRVREALCAAARAAARAGDAEGLRAFLAAHVVALRPEAERERGEALVQSSEIDVVGALDALVSGAEAASAFRTLAAIIPGVPVAVFDLVDAAMLLAPGRAAIHVTRGLVRTQAGDEEGARADAQAIEAAIPGGATSLVEYIDFVFRPFTLPGWWDELEGTAERAAEPVAETDTPAEETAGEAREKGEAGEEGEAGGEGEESGEPAAAIAQSLEAIQHLAAVYATRLGRIGAALRAARARAVKSANAAEEAPVWLPPDLSALLPEGPVELLHETVTCDPLPETGAVETIEIDEVPALEGATVPVLLAQAHADHAALAWLCWTTGLRTIEGPRAIEPPAALLPAMQLIVQRHWRANDRVKTGGLIALGKRVPGFDWLGVGIDDMPDHMVSGVLAELLAVRSMFLWLLSPDTLSPFQDDIVSA